MADPMKRGLSNSGIIIFERKKLSEDKEVIKSLLKGDELKEEQDALNQLMEEDSSRMIMTFKANFDQPVTSITIYQITVPKHGLITLVKGT